LRRNRFRGRRILANAATRWPPHFGEFSYQAVAGPGIEPGREPYEGLLASTPPAKQYLGSGSNRRILLLFRQALYRLSYPGVLISDFGLKGNWSNVANFQMVNLPIINPTKNPQSPLSLIARYQSEIRNQKSEIQFGVAQVGVEPTASRVLSAGGRPVAYRADDQCDSGGNRTRIFPCFSGAGLPIAC
jgi:hypothetical protein